MNCYLSLFLLSSFSLKAMEVPYISDEKNYFDIGSFANGNQAFRDCLKDNSLRRVLLAARAAEQSALYSPELNKEGLQRFKLTRAFGRISSVCKKDGYVAPKRPKSFHQEIGGCNDQLLLLLDAIADTEHFLCMDQDLTIPEKIEFDQARRDDLILLIGLVEQDPFFGVELLEKPENLQDTRELWPEFVKQSGAATKQFLLPVSGYTVFEQALKNRVKSGIDKKVTQDLMRDLEYANSL